MTKKIEELFHGIGNLEEKFHQISGGMHVLDAVHQVRVTALKLRDEMGVPATEKRRRQVRLLGTLVDISDAIDEVLRLGISSPEGIQALLELLYVAAPELEWQADTLSPQALEEQAA